VRPSSNSVGSLTLQENPHSPPPVVEGLELSVVGSTAYEPELGWRFSDVFLLDSQHGILIGGCGRKAFAPPG
jgi:hypothetical protein